MAVPQRMGEAPPTTAAQAAKKKSVNMTKVTKAEEAIFTLQPGKDAIVRLAAALHPFRGVLHFVEDGLSWRSANKAMTLQALYCLAVVHPEYLVPVALCVLGTCTLTNKRELEESDDHGAPKDGLRRRPRLPPVPREEVRRARAPTRPQIFRHLARARGRHHNLGRSRRHRSLRRVVRRPRRVVLLRALPDGVVVPWDVGDAPAEMARRTGPGDQPPRAHAG